jgi:GNAT superfamily N-acetyltransferase
LPELSGPVAVISVFVEHVPNLELSSVLSESPRDAPAARFRKFACRADLQGHGIGTLLLHHVMRIAREELSVDMLWCDARLATADWYEKRGLVRFGPTFFKGEVEYIRMKAALLDVSGEYYTFLTRPLHPDCSHLCSYVNFTIGVYVILAMYQLPLL